MNKTARRLMRHRGVQVGMVIVLGWAILTPLATTLTSYDPDHVDADAQLDYQNVPPSWFGAARLAPGVEAKTFLAGTDDLGRDVMGMVLYGARYSLTIGLIAVGISLVVGIPLGLVSGYYGGWTDQTLMRGVDVLMAFPAILLALCIVSMLGQSTLNLMIAVGVVGIPTIARQVRATVLTVRELDYVHAARAQGFSDLRVLGLHILPNCLAPITVLATLGMASAILETAGLGFLGMGPSPDTPEWGMLIAANKNLVRHAPWAVLTPAFAVLVLVLGFNLLGDGLRDVLDPRMRHDG